MSPLFVPNLSVEVWPADAVKSRDITPCQHKLVFNAQCERQGKVRPLRLLRQGLFVSKKVNAQDQYGKVPSSHLHVLQSFIYLSSSI